MSGKLHPDQAKVLLGICLFYGTLYMLRHNFSMAIPYIEKDLDISRTQIGWIISIASFIYGIGKIINGYLADVLNTKVLMGIAITSCIIINLSFMQISAPWIIGLVWVIGYWFQSLGWPACGKLMGLWFHRQQLGMIWGIAASSHMLGTAIIAIAAGYIIQTFSWRHIFLFPALFGIIVGVVVMILIKNTPSDSQIKTLKLDKREQNPNAPKENSTKSPLMRNLRILLDNHALWYVGLANMFVYIVRNGVLIWAPTFLQEAKGMKVVIVGWQLGAYEISGMFGGILAGIISDRFFKGMRSSVKLFSLSILTITLTLLWIVPGGYNLEAMSILFIAGFFIYAVTTLQGVSIIDTSDKQLMATATGILGTFGAIGTFIAGIGVTAIQVYYGWNMTFIFFVLCACASLLCTYLYSRIETKAPSNA